MNLNSRTPRTWSDCLLIVGWILTCAALVRAAPPDTDEMQVLARLFYEHRNDPLFDGSVVFISGIPLISSDPGCVEDSQYLASALLSARGRAISQYNSQVAEKYREVERTELGRDSLGRRVRTDALNRVHARVFGEQSTLSEALFESASHPHPHAALNPTAMPSRTEVTTGLHMLRKVDQVLKKHGDLGATINELLATEVIDWHIEDRGTMTGQQCRKLIESYVPFLLHRDDRDYLVCGLGEYEENTYWMGYDLAELERRVTLGYTSGSVSFSRYFELVAENESRKEPLKIDPLFWDYESYFSVKNLSAFRLLHARDKESVTVVYAKGLDEERLESIIREETQKAREEQAAMQAERNAKRAATREREARKESD